MKRATFALLLLMAAGLSSCQISKAEWAAIGKATAAAALAEAGPQIADAMIRAESATPGGGKAVRQVQPPAIY